MTHLDADRIRRLLLELGERADAAGMRVELAVAGGAAIALLLGSRRTTKDIDALVLHPADVARVRDIVRELAAIHGLPADWLNDGMKGYLQGLATSTTVIETTGILVRLLAIEQLLAMKLAAWRDDVDIEDAVALLGLLSGERGDVWRRIEPFLIPGRELKAQYAFEDLWSLCHG